MNKALFAGAVVVGVACAALGVAGGWHPTDKRGRVLINPVVEWIPSAESS